jgi:hypothetical protein
LPDDIRDTLVEISAVTIHLGRTVEYLLSLANRQAGIGSLARESVFFDDVVSGTVARFSRMAERRRIGIVWSELRETAVEASVHVVDQVAQILFETSSRRSSHRLRAAPPPVGPGRPEAGSGWPLPACWWRAATEPSRSSRCSRTGLASS